MHLKKYHSGFSVNRQQSSLLFNEISRDICSDIIYIVGVCGNSGFLLRRAGCSYTNPFLETKHQSKKLFDPFKHHLISLLITWSYCGTVKSRSFMPPHTVDHVYSASKDKISRREKIIWYYWIHIGVWEVEACTARLLCSKKRICRRKTIFIVYWNCSWFVHFGVLPRVFPKHDSLFHV